MNDPQQGARCHHRHVHMTAEAILPIRLYRRRVDKSVSSSAIPLAPQYTAPMAHVSLKKLLNLRWPTSRSPFRWLLLVALCAAMLINITLLIIYGRYRAAPFPTKQQQQHSSQHPPQIVYEPADNKEQLDNKPPPKPAVAEQPDAHETQPNSDTHVVKDTVPIHVDHPVSDTASDQQQQIQHPPSTADQPPAQEQQQKPSTEAAPQTERDDNKEQTGKSITSEPPARLPFAEGVLESEDAAKCPRWTRRELFLPNEQHTLSFTAVNGTGIAQGTWQGRFSASVFFPPESSCSGDMSQSMGSDTAIPALLCARDVTASTSEEAHNRSTVIVQPREWEGLLSESTWQIHTNAFAVWVALKLVDATAHLLDNVHLHSTIRNDLASGKHSVPNMKRAVDIVLVLPDAGWARLGGKDANAPVIVEVGAGLNEVGMVGMQAVADSLRGGKVMVASDAAPAQAVADKLAAHGMNKHVHAWVRAPHPDDLLGGLERQSETQSGTGCNNGIVGEYGEALAEAYPLVERPSYPRHACLMSMQGELSGKLNETTFSNLMKALALVIVRTPRRAVHNHSHTHKDGAEGENDVDEGAVSDSVRFVRAHCAVVVGAHGVGLADMVGLRRGSHVVEIGGRWERPVYGKLAGVLDGVSYTRVAFESDVVDEAAKTETNLRLDEDALKTFTEMVIGKMQDSVQKGLEQAPGAEEEQQHSSTVGNAPTIERKEQGEQEVPSPAEQKAQPPSGAEKPVSPAEQSEKKGKQVTDSARPAQQDGQSVTARLPFAEGVLESEDATKCPRWTRRELFLPNEQHTLSFTAVNGTGIAQGTWQGRFSASVFFPPESSCSGDMSQSMGSDTAIPALLCARDVTASTSEEAHNRSTVIVQPREWEGLLSESTWQIHTNAFAVWVALKLVDATAHLLDNVHLHSSIRNDLASGKHSVPNMKRAVDIVLVLPEAGWARLDGKDASAPVIVEVGAGLNEVGMVGMQAVADSLHGGKVMVAMDAAPAQAVADKLAAHGMNKRVHAWVRAPHPDDLLGGLERQSETQSGTGCNNGIVGEYGGALAEAYPLVERPSYPRHACLMSMQGELSGKLNETTFSNMMKALALVIVRTPRRAVHNHSHTQKDGVDASENDADEGAVSDSVRFVRAHCAVVVGAHGDALADMVGLRRGSHVVEIGGRWERPVYGKLAGVLDGVSYTRVTFESDVVDEAAKTETNLRLDEDALKTFTEMVIGKMQESSRAHAARVENK